MSAGIILTGNHYAKVADLFKAVQIAFLSETAYYNCQRNVLCPGLEHIWENHCAVSLGKMPDNAVVCGDGRCDSPGHCAKLLVYPIMDHSTRRIYWLEFCDKRKVKVIFDSFSVKNTIVRNKKI